MTQALIEEHIVAERQSNMFLHLELETVQQSSCLAEGQ